MAALFSLLCLGAFASPQMDRTTFDSNTNTYAELTNSLRDVKHRLEVAEKSFGGSSTNVANILSDLAGLCDDMGDYAQAASLDQRCLTIREELLGVQNTEVGDVLNDLAYEYQEMGDYDLALPLYQRSLMITEKVSGKEHYDVATTLDNMADAYRLKGDCADALPLAQRALEIREKVLGKDHADVTDSFYTLAAIRRGLGDYKEALNLCEQGIALGVRRLGPEHPIVAANLFVAGQVYGDLGDYAEAASACRRAISIDERNSGPENPDVIEELTELAIVLGKQRNIEQSISTFAEVFKRQRHYFVGQLVALPDSTALRSIRVSFQTEEIFHSICAEAPAESRSDACFAGAEGLALSKAFLEEVRAAQAALDADPRTTTKELRSQYRAATVQLDRLKQSSVSLPQREIRRRALQEELDHLETAMAERAESVAVTVRERNLTLTNIARGLPAQSALLDFVQYRKFDLASTTNRWGQPSYAAYLTFSAAKDPTNIIVERINLGEAAPINEAVELICKRMSAGQFAARDLPSALQRVGQLVYAPLAKHLVNVSHLIICPDGRLSRLPFEMLSYDGRFLIEDKTISYVGSGREITRLAQTAAKVVTSAPVVIGNPDFDLDLAKAGSGGTELLGSPISPGRSIGDAKPDGSPAAGVAPVQRFLILNDRGLSFGTLPGAEAEARSVAKLLGDECVLLLGAKAREADLKAVNSPIVLHLATHGFFLSVEDFQGTVKLRSKLMASAGMDSAVAGYTASSGHDWENPMLRCGIALAGANHALQISSVTGENGLLTGLEASLLNLHGTELVILSACDSGTGEVMTGEGMMSLRRAFRIAGAQTVLASHWSISDKATSQLMTQFMRRWRSGEPRDKAWREAQLFLLHSKDFSNPYFWAAFTLTGQWR